MRNSKSRCNSRNEITTASTIDLLNQDLAKQVRTAYDRIEDRGVSACLFGSGGTCCRICNMGPCQVIDGVEQMIGICGATAATVVARNFARIVAAGTAAHTDHAREMVMGFIETAKGKTPHKIQDVEKLHMMAEIFEIEIEGRDKNEIALELGEKALAEFGQQKGTLTMLKRASAKQQAIWKEKGVEPRGIDREVVETMHRTHMGVDQEYHNIMKQAARCSLADGWGSSMLSTELTDIMFGTPVPKRALIDLGVLKADQVNVTVHGHEPLLAESLCMAAEDPEILALVKKVGAKGINLAGVCCTGNEILMRRGIPVAGSFINQEMVLATGAVEAMVVDVQCTMQSLAQVVKNKHTDIITTNYRAKMPDAIHMQFEESDSLGSAKSILAHAIGNYKKRGAYYIPKDKTFDMVVGFSHESINYMLGGSFRESYRPLNDNIINGRIKGVGALVGCEHYKYSDDHHFKVAVELLKNNVLVLATGCAAQALGRRGLMTPEAAAEYCGESLAEVCEVVGMPPVLHVGSCVDNSRLLIALTEMVKQGGLGDDISELPACGTAPLWMSEKAVAIGQYFVTSGAHVIFQNLPVTGSKEMTDFMLGGMKEEYGACWGCEEDPVKLAQKMIKAIDGKRDELGINKKKDRVLFDMEMRRDLDAGTSGQSVPSMGCGNK
jgi:carbon-monoxide dehydrogenase catalytic subunit